MGNICYVKTSLKIDLNESLWDFVCRIYDRYSDARVHLASYIDFYEENLEIEDCCDKWHGCMDGNFSCIGDLYELGACGCGEVAELFQNSKLRDCEGFEVRVLEDFSVRVEIKCYKITEYYKEWIVH